jgi:hypothetical protein
MQGLPLGDEAFCSFFPNLVACGIYFRFRGSAEHHALEVPLVRFGEFEKGHRLEGMENISVNVMNDKTNKITLHNPYLRDTGKLMRIPILNDDPKSSCFGGTFKRCYDKYDFLQI